MDLLVDHTLSCDGGSALAPTPAPAPALGASLAELAAMTRRANAARAANARRSTNSATAGGAAALDATPALPSFASSPSPHHSPSPRHSPSPSHRRRGPNESDAIGLPRARRSAVGVTSIPIAAEPHATAGGGSHSPDDRRSPRGAHLSPQAMAAARRGAEATEAKRRREEAARPGTFSLVTFPPNRCFSSLPAMRAAYKTYQTNVFLFCCVKAPACAWEEEWRKVRAALIAHVDFETGSLSLLSR